MLEDVMFSSWLSQKQLREFGKKRRIARREAIRRQKERLLRKKEERKKEEKSSLEKHKRAEI